MGFGYLIREKRTELEGIAREVFIYIYHHDDDNLPLSPCNARF